MQPLGNFPGNAHSEKGREPVQPTRRVDSVLDAPPLVRKVTVWGRFKRLLTREEARDVGRGVFEDVVIPTMKDLFFDSIKEGAERAIYGDTRGYSRRSSPVGRGRHTSYNRPVRREEPEPVRRPLERRERSTHDFSNLIFTRIQEAENVVTILLDTIDKYGSATVADFYNAMGMTPEFTDEAYGWESLRGVQVRKVRDGYILHLPRTIQLND